MANNETDLFHVSEEPIAILSSHQIVFWIIGIIASIFGFLLQLFTMALVPAVRHYDEKLLAHLTLARCFNTLMEYVFSTSELYTTVGMFFKFFFTFYSDYSLICWMFMFTKNLYNKVVIFPNPSHPSWITVYLFCVALPAPVALLPAATSLISDRNFFTCYIVYVVLKITLNFVNIIIFCIIMKVQITKLPDRSQERLQAASDSSGDMTLLRVVVVTCVLMSVTCLQTFCTDMLSLIDGNNFYAIYCFAVVNSYQGVVITGIFLMLIKKNLGPDQSRSEEILRRIKCVNSNFFNLKRTISRN